MVIAQAEVIKVLSTAITMTIISIYADRWMNKTNSCSDNESQPNPSSKNNYIIRYPRCLSAVYYMSIGVGLIGVIIFSIAILNGVETATIQHVILFSILIAIGLAVSIWSNHWKIFVDINNEEMTIYRLFHKQETIKIKNIYKVKLGKKNEIVLYRTDKRKLITIDCLADNSERLFDMLYNAGLIHKKEEENL